MIVLGPVWDSHVHVTGKETVAQRGIEHVAAVPVLGFLIELV